MRSKNGWTSVLRFMSLRFIRSKDYGFVAIRANTSRRFCISQHIPASSQNRRPQARIRELRGKGQAGRVCPQARKPQDERVRTAGKYRPAVSCNLFGRLRAVAQTVKDTRCKIHPHHGMMAFLHSEPARDGQRTEHQFREWRQSAPNGRRLQDTSSQ